MTNEERIQPITLGDLRFSRLSQIQSNHFIATNRNPVLCSPIDHTKPLIRLSSTSRKYQQPPHDNNPQLIPVISTTKQRIESRIKLHEQNQRLCLDRNTQKFDYTTVTQNQNRLQIPNSNFKHIPKFSKIKIRCESNSATRIAEGWQRSGDDEELVTCVRKIESGEGGSGGGGGGGAAARIGKN